MKQDLLEEWTLIQVYFQIHGYTWEHPRVQEYLRRCNAKTKWHLTPKQVCNLAEKLKRVPLPDRLICA